MMKWLLHFVVLAGTMLLLAQNLPGFHVTGWGAALLAALVLGFANTVIRPILFLVTLPLTLLTLGLFLLVLNAIMLWITQAIVPGFSVHGWTALILGSLILSIVSLLWKSLFPDERKQRER